MGGGEVGGISQPRPLSGHFHTEHSGQCLQTVYLADFGFNAETYSRRWLQFAFLCCVTLLINKCGRAGFDCKPQRLFPYFGLKQQTQSVRMLSVQDCGHRRIRMLCWYRMCIVWCLVGMYLTTADTKTTCEYVFIVFQHGHVFIWQVFKCCR